MKTSVFLRLHAPRSSDGQKCVVSKQVARLFGGFWVLGLFGQTEDKTIAKNTEKFIYIFLHFQKDALLRAVENVKKNELCAERKRGRCRMQETGSALSPLPRGPVGEQLCGSAL